MNISVKGAWISAVSIEVISQVTIAPTVEATPAVDAPSATDLAVAAALSGLDLGGEAAQVVPASLTVPQSIPRAPGRPAGLRVASLTPVMNDVTGDIDPATIPPGTRLVQLGAYGSPEVARAEWANAIAPATAVGSSPVALSYSTTITAIICAS